MIPWVHYALTLIPDLIPTTALYIMILTTLLGSVLIKPTHRCWKRREAKARAQNKWRWTVQNEDVITQSKDPHFKLNQEVSDSTIDSFCDGSRDFLSFVSLMSTFNEMDNAQNVQQLCQRLAVLSYRSLNNRSCNDSKKIDPKNLILNWDTGASFGLTPFRSDFINYVEAEISVKDVTKVNKVIGIGTTLHKFLNDKGKSVFLLCVLYHLPTTYVRLFSPQTYHQMH